MLKFQLNTTVQIAFAGMFMLAGCLQQQATSASGSRQSTENRVAGEGDQQGEIQQDKKKVQESDKEQKDPAANLKSDKTGMTRSLFDGKSLQGWESIEFGGEGDIQVADGEIQMLPGDPLTGICVVDGTDLPKENYEITLKGVKRDGHDFFCGLTFPVKDNFCTLILGGWGGSLVGLSNLDGRDASENGTKVTRKFKKNQWYDIRVRVVPEKITVWIDKEKVIDESIKDREVSIRNDVISTTPLGITNFITESAFKDIKLRLID